MKLNPILSAAIAAAICSSCADSNQWTVTGTIEGANGTTIYIETAGTGGWTLLDSIMTEANGRFTYSHTAPQVPDIFRLRMGDKMLYFPIDSIETVTVNTDIKHFDRNFTITGSPDAEMLSAIDRRVNRLIDRDDLNSDSITALKRDLTDMWLADPSSIVGYYMINKLINGVPLFNPSNKFDLRVIGGVATAFSENRPGDPRTAFLERLYLSNRARNIVPTDTIVTDEVSFFDIKLYDNSGIQQSLIDAAGKNKVVMINFTSYDEEFSPSLNVLLNKIYKAHHDKGLEIYQVSFDADEFFWRESAKNLPWITVHSPETGSAELLMRYNVRQLPTVFLIRYGELLERVSDLSTLESSVARYL